MRMIRLNITLPEEIVRYLAQKQNKSRFIAQALREKLEREKRERIETLMQEGYETAELEDKELDTEWEKASLEEWD
jgi:metal-responsive CopG/Arc/MetJ family transcriptional regulator